jgi:N-acetylmuramic acid 6-phosphate (MurNAc-6-P) etherase
MRARRHIGQGSIPIPISISTMIGRIGRIGHHGLEVTHEGARLFFEGAAASGRLKR